MNYSGQVNLDHILNGSHIERAVRRRTNEIAGNARSTAPYRTGELAGSIVTDVQRNSGNKGDRVVGTVTATVGHSSATEFGTSSARPFFYLRRAAQ